ncbi:response regulator [Actinoplanes sp. KI2]|uniref:HD domain-containing phosphohydrolase n=1 Tax=Actinoplanes sp. KI2 TaxID=2983315 RepID=UPI0021D5C4F2|nr:HD domain-containing phosphohydrolase [Actinoplanes sp. KI2]MCU7722324.1 response regulator [Actinoplanes sp. KI2]
MTDRPRVLCVDDEHDVLTELERVLRTDYRVVCTTDPEAALTLLAEAGADDPISVVIAGMRMSAMTGVAMLAKAYALAPATTRIITAGYADGVGAVGAINQAHVFEFLLWPCPPENLRAAVAAAAEQHRLTHAEQQRAGRTLDGSIATLLAVLAQTQPELVARAHRMRRIAARVCAILALPDAWQVEAAAQLTIAGVSTVPQTAAAAVIEGIPRSDRDQQVLDSMFQQAAAVLAHIPDLAPVRTIIQHQRPTDRQPARPLAVHAPPGARVLQAVREYDALTHRGIPADQALATLAERGTHEPAVIEALAAFTEAQLPNLDPAPRPRMIDQALSSYANCDRAFPPRYGTFRFDDRHLDAVA